MAFIVFESHNTPCQFSFTILSFSQNLYRGMLCLLHSGANAFISSNVYNFIKKNCFVLSLQYSHFIVLIFFEVKCM